MRTRKTYTNLIVAFVTVLLVAVATPGCQLTGSSGGVVCQRVTREARGCDQMQGCRCLHNSWGGLGSCTTCECEECLVP